MRVCLVCGETALVDHRLHEGVVAGDLGQLAVTQEVGARVADVEKTDAATVEEKRGERAAHALAARVLLHGGGDRVVAGVHRLGQCAGQVRAGLVLVERGQCADHQLRGDLARGVPAHAVRERKKARAGESRILVVVSNQAEVGPGEEIQRETHERNSIVVVPMRTGVPWGTFTEVVTFVLSK